MKKFIQKLLDKIAPYSCPTCDSYNVVKSETGGTCRDCKQTWEYGKPIVEDDSFVDEDGQRW